MAKWWHQFPRNLQLVAEVRALAALGAGGILFLGPLVFNRIGLNPSLIGQGLALAGAGRWPGPGPDPAFGPGPGPGWAGPRPGQKNDKKCVSSL